MAKQYTVKAWLQNVLYCADCFATSLGTLLMENMNHMFRLESDIISGFQRVT